MEDFSEVIRSNDVEALKSALENLLVLFETQNRNYNELKSEVKKMKTPVNYQFFHSEDINILPTENLPINNDDELLNTANQTLASLRLSRKLQKETNKIVIDSLKSLINTDDDTKLKLTTIFES